MRDGPEAAALTGVRCAQVERQRGITVRAQTASMLYTHPESGLDYLLNLVDTPGACSPTPRRAAPCRHPPARSGHVDFSYEVSRALAACQGALLLVDSSQGIQAQTLANYSSARKANLKVRAPPPPRTRSQRPHAPRQVIPVLTKVDLPHANPEAVDEQVKLAIGASAPVPGWGPHGANS